MSRRSSSSLARLLVGAVPFAALAAASVGLVACLSPSPPSGAYKCGTNSACPDGYQCATDQLCYKKGQGPDLAPPVDMAKPAPDLSEFGLCGAYCDCAIVRGNCGFSYFTPDRYFVDLEDCVFKCQAVSTTVQDCWVKHCGFVVDQPTAEFHCPHATGTDTPDAVTGLKMCHD